MVGSMQAEQDQGTSRAQMHGAISCETHNGCMCRPHASPQTPSADSRTLPANGPTPQPSSMPPGLPRPAVSASDLPAELLPHILSFAQPALPTWDEAMPSIRTPLATLLTASLVSRAWAVSAIRRLYLRRLFPSLPIAGWRPWVDSAARAGIPRGRLVLGVSRGLHLNMDAEVLEHPKLSGVQVLALSKLARARVTAGDEACLGVLGSAGADSRSAPALKGVFEIHNAILDRFWTTD